MGEHWQRGGIIALVRLDRETDGALTADCMERLGCTLAKARLFYGWHSLAVWARHLPQESATWRAQHPDEAAFASAYGRALIATDIFDAIAYGTVSIVKANRATMRDPKPYPRPNAKDRDARHFGSGGIPISEFDAWYYAQDE